MKKDKEWLKKEVFELYPRYGAMYVSPDYETVAKTETISKVLELIDQLDESELTQDQVDNYLHERNFVAVDAMMVHQTGMQNKVIVERPVIPQFVADYIEKWKYEGLIMHEWFTFDHDDQDEEKVSKWLYNNDNETNKRREFMLIDAIRYSYEVEKEKLYHVVNKENYFLLRKYDGLVDILHALTAMSRDKYGKDTRFMLTEQEIKDYDERFWEFAEEVTE